MLPSRSFWKVLCKKTLHVVVGLNAKEMNEVIVKQDWHVSSYGITKG